LSSKKEFSLSKLNKPDNWNKLPDMAKKHLPTIEVSNEVKPNESFIVKVKVGGIDDIEHPNTLGHWINWVRLYAGERLISLIEFAPEICDSYLVSLSINLNESTTLRAQGFCNLHGVWEGKEVQVKVG
jgi:superoxide reductase